MSENADAAEQETSGIRGLINAGTEIAGGAVGAALEFLAAGPVGAALFGAGGTVAAMALKRIGQEASERLLGPREAVRVGGVLAIAAGEIRQRLERGELVRTDGFFERNHAGRFVSVEEVTPHVY